MISILSIDGGGIRGLIPATYLVEMEKRLGRPICQLFDLIAGTSTGGIIAATLTLADGHGQPKYTAEQIVAAGGRALPLRVHSKQLGARFEQRRR